MNREGGETFLRLLAEAEMRDQLTSSPPPWTGGPGAGRVKVKLAGQALTAVRALDTGTVEDILADFDLAVSVRRLHHKAGQGLAGTGLPGPRARTMRTASAARLAAQIQFGRARVDLTPAGGPAGGEPEVSETTLSPGEQLLVMLAEQLLTVAAQFPLAPGPGMPEISPRPVGGGLEVRPTAADAPHWEV